MHKKVKGWVLGVIEVGRRVGRSGELIRGCWLFRRLPFISSFFSKRIGRRLEGLQQRRLLNPSFNTIMPALILLLCSFIFNLAAGQLDPRIDPRITLSTPEAIYLGMRETLDTTPQKTIYSFRGIPYAQPPIGPRRWKEPELMEARGTVTASREGPPCPQKNRETGRIEGSEDCLTLNVFSPTVPGTGRSAARSLLPVIFYIHPGGFSYGSGSRMGPRRLLRQDVVLVTINYRLGMLGFLSADDEDLPGNYGALDVTVALRWVKRYIRGFGGNPERVTIWGHSAGAALAHLLLLSPHSREGDRGLFSGAILSSGSAFCPWSIQKNPVAVAEKVAEIAGCSVGDLSECLRTREAQDLVEIQESLYSFWVLPISFAPVVDSSRLDPFLPADPRALTKAGAFAQVPVMSGLTSAEGVMPLVAYQAENSAGLKDETIFRQETLPQILEAIFGTISGAEVEAVYRQYFTGLDFENGTAEIANALSEMFGDAMFNSCGRETAEALSKTSSADTFAYVFSHKGPRSPQIMRSVEWKLPQAPRILSTGVPHAEDMFYAFEPMAQLSSNIHERLTPPDERVSDTFTRLITGFAGHGTPRQALALLPSYPQWPKANDGIVPYYNISLPPLSQPTEFRKGENLFWERGIGLVKELGDQVEGLQIFPLLFYIFLALFIITLAVAILLGILLHRHRTRQRVTL